ncbi:MAG: hypothetical protein COA81_00610 [Alphaproteobacteria bacterium]|nr:MAG: hypothetical protein COA81_00610 [Alphaproteobacteria bacterium]
MSDYLMTSHEQIQKLKIELFTGTSCPACITMKDKLKAIINEFDQTRLFYRELDIVEEIDYAVKIGILKTPAIALNSKLFSPSFLSMKALRKVILEHLNRHSHEGSENVSDR